MRKIVDMEKKKDQSHRFFPENFLKNQQTPSTMLLHAMEAYCLKTVDFSISRFPSSMVENM